MQEGKSIGEFLIELGEDPDRLAAYKQDPRGVLAESGLSEEHQQALLSGEVRRGR